MNMHLLGYIADNGTVEFTAKEMVLVGVDTLEQYQGCGWIIARKHANGEWSATITPPGLSEAQKARDEEDWNAGRGDDYGSMYDYH
jgi:hypothetical protein